MSLKIKKTLEKAKKIALLGHIHPDGDCLGSMLGL
jgi:nanoRNase/pAp phosphatase (c-di-AMP/oligoRNAs hydrolase)